MRCSITPKVFYEIGGKMNKNIEPAFREEPRRRNDEPDHDDHRREDEGKDFLAPLFVRSGVVDEEGEEGVVGDGRQQRRVEQRVEVRRELPKSAGPVVFRPAWNWIVPVDL
jgi:hypothetical protein